MHDEIGLFLLKGGQLICVPGKTQTIVAMNIPVKGGGMIIDRIELANPTPEELGDQLIDKIRTMLVKAGY